MRDGRCYSIDYRHYARVADVEMRVRRAYASALRCVRQRDAAYAMLTRYTDERCCVLLLDES